MGAVGGICEFKRIWEQMGECVSVCEDMGGIGEDLKEIGRSWEELKGFDRIGRDREEGGKEGFGMSVLRFAPPWRVPPR